MTPELALVAVMLANFFTIIASNPSKSISAGELNTRLMDPKLEP